MGLPIQPPLLEHQSDCVSKTSEELTVSDRCKVIMACGTGKTRIGTELALSVKANTVVVYLPSLALVRQTLPEWIRTPFTQGMEFLCVCSDDTVADPFNDIAQVSVEELVEDLGIARANVTTNPKVIHDFLNKSSQSVRVVFCTYQSCDTLRDGLPVGFSFDFGLLDEAHKTAGRNVAFSAPLSNSHTPIRKRVAMTATPKHFDIRKRDKDGDVKLAYSMDDEESYGRTAYNLPIRKAIELGIIAGYQVLISVIDDKSIAKTLRNKTMGDTQHEAVAHAIAIKNAMQEYGLKKAVTFHDTVENASFFSRNELIKQELDLSTYHVSGQVLTKDRSAIMDSFASDEKALVTNARCLTEGVDVPAIDLIAFLHPKKSPIDIIQAIGRALRKPQGGSKQTGYILLPIYVSDADNGGLERALEEYGYDTIFQVIQALSEQDEVVQGALQQYKINRIQNKRDANIDLGFIKVNSTWAGMQVDVLRNVISTRIVDSLVESWFTNFALLQEIFAATGNANIEKQLTYKDNNLGYWCSTQRANFKNKILSANKIRLLESIGFKWSILDSTWDAHYNVLLSQWKSTGSSHVRSDSIIDGLNIREWVLGQRKLYKEKKLSLDRVEKLNAIKFSYDFKGDVWMSYFSKLKEYNERVGNIKLSVDFIVDELKLGSWLNEQRKRYKKGLLSEDRINLLESLNMTWDELEEKWDSNYLLLKNVFDKTGDANVTNVYVSNGVRIGSWLTTQKSSFYEGRLSDNRKVMLESLGVKFDRPNNSWDDNFKIFSEFWVTQNDVDDPSHEFYRDNRSIRTWVLRQRENYHSGKLGEDKLRKLESIGFDFKVSKTVKLRM